MLSCNTMGNMLKFFIFIFCFSTLAIAQEIGPVLQRSENELTILFEEKDSTTRNPVKEFHDHLKVKTIELDQGQLLISCIHDNELYSCKIKTSLKSHAYRNLFLLPNGDLVITLKGKLAWEYADLTTGQMNTCYQVQYATNFATTICPNTVDIVITSKKN